MSYLKAIGMGVVAGMRSMTAPALVSHELNRTRSRKLERTPLAFLASPEAAAVTQFLALGEIAADKTPWIPDRISPPALIARGLSGALAGAAVCCGDEEPPEAGAAIGAVIGAASALASAFTMYHLRKRLGEELRVPDPFLGALEDAVAVGGGLLVLRSDELRAAASVPEGPDSQCLSALTIPLQEAPVPEPA
jgi:uncharacterized membrane protein